MVSSLQRVKMLRHNMRNNKAIIFKLLSTLWNIGQILLILPFYKINNLKNNNSHKMWNKRPLLIKPILSQVFDNIKAPFSLFYSLNMTRGNTVIRLTSGVDMDSISPLFLKIFLILCLPQLVKFSRFYA